METYQSLIGTLSLTLGAAWASGINLYAALFMLGYLHASGNIALPPELQMLASPIVLAAAGFMYLVEFFADKTPGVDTAWDTLHTFIRIPAGAILAAQAIGDVSPAAELAAAIVGGGIAGVTHATKAGARVLINTSPEPFSNWTASIGEDVLVIAGLWAALHHPAVFLLGLGIFLLLLAWLLPYLWRGIRRIFAFFGRLFGGKSSATAARQENIHTATAEGQTADSLAASSRAPRLEHRAGSPPEI